MLVTHRALSIRAGIPRGSSCPVVADTTGGRFVVKLRGAAHGVLPLIAEIVVGELAIALGLPVPERALVLLDEDVPVEDWNDELEDLLRRSYGVNLGIRFLPGAEDLRSDRLTSIAPAMAARIRWLDGLVMNPDRTRANPNIMMWHRQPWLIDHGAALAFHYDWSKVTEQSPREDGPLADQHAFADHDAELADLDEEAARLVSREVIERALGEVPDAFILTAFPSEHPERVRAAYVAFLWKRLKAPRPFVPAH